MTRAIAWTAPVVTVAVAAPAYASSGGKPTLTQTAACKSPGNSCKVFPKGYQFTFNACNTTGKDVYLYSVTYTVDGTSLTLTHAKPDLPILLKDGGCVDLVFRADSSNSANQTFTGTMTVQWGHTPSAADDTEHTQDPILVGIEVTGTPPDCPCTETP